MTPQHIKMFLSAINSNIENYEKKFGEIKLVGDAAGAPIFGFQPPGKEEKVN
jgi:hypothetical protein